MTEGIPRYVIALAALVALVVVSISIKDYMEEKHAKPSASTSASVPAADNTTTATKKKTSSAKTFSARKRRPLETGTWATKASVPAKAQSSATNMGALPANGNAPTSGITQAAQREDESVDGSDRVRHELGSNITRPSLLAPKCVPLPNMTNSRDVDAPYYQNWAREYSCLVI